MGLFTVRDLQNALFLQSAGVNVEIEATCCMKQLRHYACCRPATLRGRRVQAADGDLAAEQHIWYTLCGLSFFLKSADGLELLSKNLSIIQKAILKNRTWGNFDFP